MGIEEHGKKKYLNKYQCLQVENIKASLSVMSTGQSLWFDADT